MRNISSESIWKRPVESHTTRRRAIQVQGFRGCWRWEELNRFWSKLLEAPQIRRRSSRQHKIEDHACRENVDKVGQDELVFVSFYPHEQLLAKLIFRRALSLCGNSRCKLETN